MINNQMHNTVNIQSMVQIELLFTTIDAFKE